MENWFDSFLSRIDKLLVDSVPIFGQMTVNQMLCHCADQIRTATGDIKLAFDDTINPDEIKKLGVG